MKKSITSLSAAILLQLFSLCSIAQTASITCPGDKTVATSSNSCTAIVNGIDPVIVPAGAAVRYLISPSGESGGGSASGKSFGRGMNTVTYSLLDYPGVACTFTIWVEDHTPPVITCPPNVTVQCKKEIPVNTAIAVDACSQPGFVDVKLISETRTNITCFNRFTLTRTYKATDEAGNTSTCSQIITVHDDEAPYFPVPPPPSPVNVSCTDNLPTVFPLTGRDKCLPDDEFEDINAVFKQVKTDGACENKYTLTRTWTLSDACGNTAVYTQVINVDDSEGPRFSMLPASLITVNCASEVPAPEDLTASDNCSGQAATVKLDEVISEQQCANKFRLKRTWTATDGCGNTSTVSQVVIVEDKQAPVFGGMPPETGIEVSCTKDLPEIPNQTATDNCDGVPTITFTEVKTNVQCVNRYTLTRKWVASDECGNTASRTQVIVVNDTEGPQVTAISADPVALWPPNHKMRDVTINYSATDNCEVTSTLSVSSSDPINGGSDGDQAPDWQIIDGHHVKLRAEKANNGQARYYNIKITISDGCNAPVDTSIDVVVAHNITGPQTGQPFKVGSTVAFTGTYWDKPGNKHTAKWLLDGSAAANGTVTEPAGKQNGKVTGSYKFNSPGVYKLQMNITDQKGITSYANTNNDLDAIVVVYDPDGGSAFGGGWFQSTAGALTSDAKAEGKASYGFSVNYRNAAKPKGETQIEFKVGAFEFNALNFDYLVINKAMAQFKGTGKIIGGQSGIGFIMTVIDGELDGSDVDKIRMKIYNRNTGYTFYDNQPGASEAEPPVHAVGDNSTIVISGSNASLTSANTSQKAEMETSGKELQAELNISAFPNPSAGNFTMTVKTSANEKITMQVVDMYGRVIESRSINVNSSTRFGERYKPGTYLVRIIQGDKHKEMKLIKISD